MVETDFIPQEALQSIASQIGVQIISLADPELLSRTEIELAETFQFWMLGAEPLEFLPQGSEDLAQLVQPTGRWHHQIRFNGEATAFARSSQPDEDSDQWLLCELFISPFAKRIAAGLDRIDRMEPTINNNPVVRLLIAPAYKVNALWLFDQHEETSQVLVIDRPKEFTDLQTELVVDSKDFLAALTEVHPVIGISFPREMLAR